MLRRREITQKVEEHPELHDPCSQAFMTRAEEMENAARKVNRSTFTVEEIIDNVPGNNHDSNVG